jgi:uncharacterized protein YciW
VDPTADHLNDPQHVDQPDTFLAQAHLLLDNYIGHLQDLRGLHQEYAALQREEMSKEQRREAFREILGAELAVLEDARIAREALQALLNDYMPHQPSGE